MMASSSRTVKSQASSPPSANEDALAVVENRAKMLKKYKKISSAW